MPFDGAGFGYNESLHKLDTVIDLLETPDRWCKGALRSHDGRYCIRGAIRAVSGSEVLEPAILQAIGQVAGRRFRRIDALSPKLGQTFRRRDRNREHEPRRIMAREAAQSRLDGGAGRDPVINDNRDPPLCRERRPIAQVILPPPLDLGELTCLLGFDIARAWRDASHDILVQHELRVLAI